MIRKIFFYILCMVSNIALAQDADNELHSISLSVIMPAYENADLSLESLSKIESKIQHIVTKNGISGSGLSQEFLIYPKFKIYDESIISAMRNIVKIEVEFNLFIIQYSTMKIYATYTKSLKGSGYSRQKAINNAISAISVNDPKLEVFIKTGEEKIIAYFENSCNQIMKDVDAYTKIKQYKGALLQLATIPKEAGNCYEKAQEKLVQVYQSYQDLICQTNLLRARNYKEGKDYESALKEIADIDPTSSCASFIEEIWEDIRNDDELTAAQKQKHREEIDKIMSQTFRTVIIKELADASPKQVTEKFFEILNGEKGN